MPFEKPAFEFRSLGHGTLRVFVGPRSVSFIAEASPEERQAGDVRYTTSAVEEFPLTVDEAEQLARAILRSLGKT